MNVQDYKASGFGLSILIDQTKIDRAEKDVLAAYILPVLGIVPTEEEKQAEPLKTAIMALSYLLVQQRNAVATRAGAKTKQTEQSGTPTSEDVLRQNASSCALALRTIGYDAKKHKIDDICGIFFKSNYFSI